MKSAVIVLLFAAVLAAGCAAARPCMTGFELGINGGRLDSPFNLFDSNYAGGHATVYFDTTGSCQGPRY